MSNNTNIQGELLALTSADIDFDNKLIDINKTYQRLQGKDVITTPKTRKSKRKVPIPDFLCDELKDFISTRYMITPDERLFPITKSYLSHEMIHWSSLLDNLVRIFVLYFVKPLFWCV